MEKLKSVFNPGSKADEDVLYGEGNSNNLGKVTGEGSHFGHSRTTDSTAATSDPAKNPEADPAVDASKAVTSDAGTQQPKPSSNNQSSSDDAVQAAQKASKPQTQEIQNQAPTDPTDPQRTTAGLAASRADANRHGNILPDRSVTAAGNSSADSQKTHPIYDEFTSGGTNPYNSHTIDPRVDPSAKSQPQASHAGRDVALGGASAGAAAYEGNKLQDEHKQLDQKSAAEPSQPTSISAPTASKPASSTPSQPAGPTSANYDSQRATAAATSQPQASEPPASRPSQQSQPAGTGYYVAPHGTAVGNEKPTDHHSNLGRDAAIGAGVGAAGVGGYEAMKHRAPADQTQSTHPVSNIQHTGAAPTGYDAQRAPATTTTQPLSSTPSTSHPPQQPQPTASGYYTQPSSQSQAQPNQHHYGRDAAAAAGTGAAGVGGYEALKHHENKDGATPNVPSADQQTLQGSQVPHVQAGGVPGQAITTDSRQPAPTTQPQSGAEHHYGRDAAVGAGAGAAGIGGYDALEHHENKESLPSGAIATNQQPARATEPTPSQSTTSSQVHPTAAQEQKPSEHQYGRDAAIGAGAVGAGGAAAYEAKKHEEEKKALEEQQRQQKEAEAAEKAHEKEIKKQEKQHEKEVKKEEKQQEKEAKKAEKQHEKEVKKEEKQHEKEVKAAEKQHEKEVKKEEKQHEKEVKAAEAEREKQAKKEAQEHEKLLEEERRRKEKEAAAAAAGVGAAGLGAEEYDRRKEKDSDDEKGEGKKKGGLLGLFHRDKKDKESEAEHHEDKHHKGEEAVAGAGAVGAAGLGKHELDKHKENEQTLRTGSTATDSDDGKKKGGILGGILHKNKKDKDSVDEKPDEKTDEHHYGRDAAIGAGAVGAGALGKHEYDEHKDREPKATAGNIQSPDASRAVDDTQQGDSHPGKEAAAGAGVLGAGALGKHEYDNRHRTPQDQTSTGQASSTIPPTESQTQRDIPTQDDPGKPQHHYKEEAAAGAGVAGAGLLGKHEYDKRRQETPQDTATTQPASASQATRPQDEAGHPHRKEETAAAAGAVGAGAVGKHEVDRHHQTGNSQDLGVSQGYVNEHYRHPKTEADIAAEKRNDTPVLGQIHREGHFHGKEGGAPGATGLPPEERDQAYIESQKHAHTEHKKPGLLDKILHRHKDDETTEASGSHHDGRNRLHKDPPGDHPAANTTVDPTTGLPIDTSKGPHTGAGTDGIPHGHHSENLPDTKDVNVQHPDHDPAHMGYGADASGRYNV